MALPSLYLSNDSNMEVPNNFQSQNDLQMKLERRDPLDEEDMQNTDEKPIFPKVQYGSGFEEKGFVSNLSNNPWNVINAEVFLKYCCPECEFKSEEFFIFSQHALTNHTLSNALFGDGNSFEKSSYEYPYSEKSQRISKM